MIKKLLITLTVVIGTIGVGWAQGATIYYKVLTGSGGAGTELSPITCATIDEAIKAANENTAADSAVVSIPQGTYTLSGAVTISKKMAIIGEDSTNTKLTGVLNIDASTTLWKLSIEAKTAICTGVVNMRANNASLLIRDCAIAQNAAGNADSWGGMTFVLNITNASGTAPENATIELYNSRLNLNEKYQRGIAYSSGDINKTTLLMDNSQIMGKDNPSNMTYCRGVSLSGVKTPELTIRNKSRIEGVYYAVNLSKDKGNPKVTIDNSFIAGFAAFNIWDSGCQIDVKNGSVLEGRNYYPKGSNDFATIVLNHAAGGDQASNNIITVTDSEIRNVMASTSPEFLVDMRGDNKNTINLKGATTLTSTNDKLGNFIEVTGTNNTVNTESTVKFQVKVGEGAAKPAITIADTIGNIRNAFTTLLAAAINLKADETLVLPEGTYALDKQLIVNKPITVIGAGAGTIITAAEGANLWKGESSTKNLISIEGKATGTVALKDLTIQGSKASGINVQSAMTTTLNNVTLKNNKNAGMIVHSKVDATGLHTEGNTWGGVNVDKGTPDYANLVFKFEATSTFAEVNKVWSEITDNAAIVNAPAEWRNYVIKGIDGKKDMRLWNNASLTTEVADAASLTAAITFAQPGQIIILTAATYGTQNAPVLMGEVRVDSVTIKAKDGLTAKPKVYGTIRVKAEGCTINGLEMYTKSDGTPALKNIINVFAMSATITNNVFNIQVPTSGNVSNAVCIWPYGVAEKTAYVISGNTFNKLQGQAGIWGSTALQLAEGLPLSSFGYAASEMSKVVTLANEKELLTANTFKNCDLDYAHADWTTNASTNATGSAPYYSFTGNSNVDAFKDAVAYSTTKAYIEASFITEKQALDVLNTKDAIAHVNAVPDSIVINCKDAYLVTGEKAAKAFAATERDKAVFWLKRATAADYTFSTVAVGNNWRIIGKNTTWNDAANVNRSVEIKAGAKLTINVAMALDSVRMDEGAELITALPVTAKTLQAKYTVAANKWKPFAFPVSGMTVKDAKDANTVALVASTADGVWFAGLSATTAPTFAHTTAFAQAGIIAANVETEILVASPATSITLITKPEPTAPTTTGFKLEANPNLFAMTLTQTAYVLNEEGTAFERRDGAVIKPFQCYVLADARTTATLRSLRVDGVVTENEIIPTEGYYVESAQGAIVIHTAESVVVEVVDMTGRIVYKAQETMDGCRIALPAGIYAVNRQMVIVK